MSAEIKKIIIDVPTIYFGTITNPSDLSGLQDNELGMTSGGLKLSFVPTTHDIEFDNRNGRKIKDMSRVLAWECSAEATGIELSEKMLDFSLLKKSGDNLNGYNKFVPSNEVTYQDIVIVGKLHETNKPAVVVMKNCFNENGLSLDTKDSDEAKFNFKAVAHYEYNPLEEAKGNIKMPVEIFLPSGK